MTETPDPQPPQGGAAPEPEPGPQAAEPQPPEAPRSPVQPRYAPPPQGAPQPGWQPSADPSQPQPQPADPVYSAQPGYPGTPPQAVQPPYAPAVAGVPRRGLPVGAWIGIGGGVVLVLAIALVAAFLVVPRVLHFVGAAGAPPAPVAPLEDDEFDPSPEPDTSTVTLDDRLDYAAGPFWSVPFTDGWTIDTFDVDGYNRFSQVETGCKLLTFQGAGDPAETSDSDRVASENLLEIALTIGLPWEATADPEVVPEGSVDVLFNYERGVEMAHYRASYPSAGGDRERRILIREFTPGNNALYAEVDCPSAEIDTVADQVFDELGITDI